MPSGWDFPWSGERKKAITDFVCNPSPFFLSKLLSNGYFDNGYALWVMLDIVLIA